MGTYNGFKQSLLDRAADLQRLGECRLATRCVQRLLFLESRLTRLEILLREGPKVDVESLLSHARRREAWDQEVRSREIADLESHVVFWVGQQRSLEERIGDATSTVSHLRAELEEAEATMRGLQSESVKVNKTVEEETRSLHTLRQEDAAARSSFEDRARKEAEDKAREDHARRVAAVKAELTSFSLLD